VVAGALLAGCSTKVRPYACGEMARREVVHARELWDCHRAIVVRVIERRPFTLREFRRAAEFFERVTGIRGDVRPSPHGPLPGPNLSADLRRWDGWLETHDRRMYWDPVGRTVRVLPEKPPQDEPPPGSEARGG
jgi:hypothetical protein